ncbi:MAG: tetratricopeptide repeat protein [Cyclobacteriaceae bacterium]
MLNESKVPIGLIVLVLMLISFDNYCQGYRQFEKMYHLHYENENYDSALYYLDILVANNNQDQWLYYNSGFIKMTFYDSKLEEAVEDFSEAIEIKPEMTDSYLARGIAYLRLSDYEKAVTDFSRVITINEDYDSIARINRALAYTLSGHQQEALDDYSILLEYYPDNVDFLMNKYSCLNELKEDSLAQRELDKAFKIDPGNGRVNLMIGIDLIQKRKGSEAIPYMSKAMEIFDNEEHEEIVVNPFFYIQRGSALFFLGEDERAIKDVEKVLKYFPNLAYAHFLLYDLYSQSDKEKACISLWQAYKLGMTEVFETLTAECGQP